MKKHILSMYSKKINNELVKQQLSGETKNMKNLDQNEFLIGSTNITKSLEASDTDEFFLSSTIFTENVESSDADEFFTDKIECCYGEDFDNILLI
ncbi:MAG: hypothetical protein HFE58_11420 [Firmicutes bacterium]|nr:hypothetical protein [Bacillota bacterium]